MIVVYTPEGGEPEHYDASTLRVSEASIVQRTIDKTWLDILRGLEEDDLDGMRGIVWVIKKRSNPGLRFGDFDPGVTEMTTRMSNREVTAFIEPLFAEGVANPELTTDVVADMLRSRIMDAAADPEFANVLIDRLAAEADAPKDQPHPEPEPEPTEAKGEESSPSPSPTSSAPEPSTSGSSRTSSTSRRRSSTTSSSATSTT